MHEKNRHRVVGVLLAGLICCSVATPRVVAAEPPMEYSYLDGIGTPKRWGPAECEVTLSQHQVWQRPAVRMYIPVDYHSGEKAYPIGWPRMYLNLGKDEQVWELYDYFEFQVFTESSREKLPKTPLLLQIHDKQGHKKSYILDKAAIGQWQTVQIKLADLGLAESVTRIGFNINEADYHDKDMVTFHLGGFRLARYTIPFVSEFKALAPAVFVDTPILPLELVVTGTADKLAGGLPLQLVRDGAVIMERMIAVKRGRQSVALPLEKVKLAPGVCQVVLFPNQPELRRETEVTITTTPWR